LTPEVNQKKKDRKNRGLFALCVGKVSITAHFLQLYGRESKDRGPNRQKKGNSSMALSLQNDGGGGRKGSLVGGVTAIAKRGILEGVLIPLFEKGKKKA